MVGNWRYIGWPIGSDRVEPGFFAMTVECKGLDTVRRMSSGIGCVKFKRAIWHTVTAGQHGDVAKWVTLVGYAWACRNADSKYPASSLVQIQPSPPFGDVAQLGERLPCTQEVAGSSPVVSTTNLKGRASYDSIGKAGAYGNLCPLHDW